MKQNVSGCFFSEHSVYCFELRNIMRILSMFSNVIKPNRARLSSSRSNVA